MTDAKAPLGGPGQILKIPLLAFGVGGAAYYEYTMNMGWFSHHPAAMLVAFVALVTTQAICRSRCSSSLSADC